MCRAFGNSFASFPFSTISNDSDADAFVDAWCFAAAVVCYAIRRAPSLG